jgi:DNA-binding protein H-NS
MSIDELWTLHTEIAKILATKIAKEKAELEARLVQLGRTSANDVSSGAVSSHSTKRPYPQVTPKYSNPLKPSETWSGRGKTPRWLKAQLDEGRSVEEFRISSSSS